MEDHFRPSDPDFPAWSLALKFSIRSDSFFVARELRRALPVGFREERTGLALELLSQIRRHTNRFMHLQARLLAPIRFAGERRIALGFDFLSLFT